MKQQEVFKKIGGIVQEINEQYEYLQGSEDNLNDLELELFVANTHFLKDHAEILRKLNAIKSQPITKKTSDEPKWFEPVVQPAKPAAERTPFKPVPPNPVKNEDIKFEIVAPEEPDVEEEPVAQIDLSNDTPADSYSFEREEPEIIRHNLVLDEAAEDEEQTGDETLLTPVAEVEEPQAPEAEPEPEIEEPEQIVAEAEPEPEIEQEPEIEAEPEPEPVKEAAAKKPVAESMEDIQIESLKSNDKGRKTVTEKPKAEEKGKGVLTLNQLLSAQIKEKNTVAATTQIIEPLADIKTAINLNDKLLFVKDLFKGYNLAYTEAIEIVNRFSSFEEADRFLRNNYVTKNNWEGKQETADKFYALLRRRYA